VCFRQVIAPAATVTKSLIYWWAHKDSNLGPADCKLAAPQKCRAFWGLWMVKGKPGSACGICVHPQRHLIELAMMHRVPVRVLARRFPDVGHDCFFRHRRNHMPPQLKAALLAAVHPTEVDLEQLERSESEGLLGSLVSQRARLQLLSELAFEAGEISAATSVERAITQSLELTSKLLGMIVQRHDVRSTSILISADYLQLRGAIIGALKPYPEAARAVGAALAELELSAAKDITESGRPLLLEAAPC
jgi:hypothetical protein